MKICFLSTMHPATDKRVFDKEAISLKEAGHEVFHLCPDTTSYTKKIEGINIITYTKLNGIYQRILNLFKIYSLAKKLDCDAYHCNEVDSWFIGVLLKILNQKICIFDVHEHYPSTFAETRFPKPIQPFIAILIRLIYQLLLPFTNRIVLAKKTVSKDFICPNRKKILVRNFTQIQKKSISTLDKVTKNHTNEIRIIHLGLISLARGWPQILEALNILDNKNIKLIIIGTFNDGSESDFLSKAKNLGLDKQIEIHNWMCFQDAFKILCNAHIGIVAFQPGIQNHTFAMPHKLFDYMNARLAVLCPNFALEIAPIIEKYNCGILIDPAKPQNIADSIGKIIASPKKLQEMGDAGYQAVTEKYNWECEAKKLINMYKELERPSYDAI